MIYSGPDSFSKSQALSLITTELGFPHPSPKYLRWYFTCYDGAHYVPKVDFAAIRKEIEAKKLVEKLGNVVRLPFTSTLRSSVIAEIRHVVEKHQLKRV